MKKTDTQAGDRVSRGPQGSRADGADASVPSGCHRHTSDAPSRGSGETTARCSGRGPSCCALAWWAQRGPLSPSLPIRTPVSFMGLHLPKAISERHPVGIGTHYTSSLEGHRHPVHIFSPQFISSLNINMLAHLFTLPRVSTYVPCLFCNGLANALIDRRFNTLVI